MTDAAPPVRYRERLWPGPLGWGVVLFLGGFAFVALLPVRPGAAAVAAVATVLLGAAVATWTSPTIAVRGRELVAGRAHIPVDVLGGARALDREGVRAALGPGSDARAFACLRAWIPSAVEVDVVDPADPTPTWLVSTRHPRRLLSALEQARGPSGQAAHSEQIG